MVAVSYDEHESFVCWLVMICVILAIHVKWYSCTAEHYRHGGSSNWL